MRVNERVKEAPVSALRAMFAGIGSLLSVTDKIRPKHAASQPAAGPEVTAAGATAAADIAAAPEAPAGPKVTAGSEAPAEPEATAVTEPAAEPAAIATPEASVGPAAEPAALPIANYDALSIASLRARLRNLSVEQLAELVAYEKGHAAREDVVALFERRIAKVESEA